MFCDVDDRDEARGRAFLPVQSVSDYTRFGVFLREERRLRRSASSKIVQDCVQLIRWFFLGALVQSLRSISPRGRKCYRLTGYTKPNKPSWSGSKRKGCRDSRRWREDETLLTSAAVTSPTVTIGPEESRPPRWMTLALTMSTGDFRPAGFGGGACCNVTVEPARDAILKTYEMIA